MDNSPIQAGVAIFLALFLFSCEPGNDKATDSKVVDDPHSYAQPWEIYTDSLDLDLTIDFNTLTVTGVARHFIKTTGENEADTFILDTDNLHIDSVMVDGENVTYEFGPEDELLGTPLYIPVHSDSRLVDVYYQSDPSSAAFLWVKPNQTADKEYPFLFTQGQAILTRSWIPCQDSPGIRFPYSATVRVPQGMMAVMSAENPTEKDSSGVYNFRMELPVPAYLIALAVGDIEFIPVGNKTGVYCEPSMVEACKYEFAEMEDMLEAAEQLYGKYRWGRYDIIILPPGFPFGGMENPRLTFATPTIIAGDQSLTSLIAHELAHSWSGNLVTNETWNDFWLNEGFTTYFERRIMEALYGKDYADMLAQLGYQDLMEDVSDLGEYDEDTHLKLELEGRDPDDGMTDIAYEKGALFLTAIEHKVGREKFDDFLRNYFDRFAFKTMNTDQFIEYLGRELPESKDSFDIASWIFAPGLPDEHPVVHSVRFNKVDSVLTAYHQDGKIPGKDLTVSWSTHEWLYFLRGIDEGSDPLELANLGNLYGLNTSGNSEIVAIWLEKNIRMGRTKLVMTQLEDFLTKVGRRKFLSPLYRALIESGNKDIAIAIFNKAGDNYHAIAFNSIAKMIGTKN